MFARKNDHAMTSYNPFRMMDDLERSFFAEPFGYFRGDSLAEFHTDVRDEGDSFVLDADLPGFDKKDIQLDVEGDVLTINAQRHSLHENKDKKGSYLCCERSYGAYSRSFDVSGIRADEIKAKYENGVLTLTMPKKVAATPASRRLEIE